MAKEENPIDKNISHLNQLVDSLEEAAEKMEEAYNEKDHESFSKSKRLILQIQKEISEVIK